MKRLVPLALVPLVAGAVAVPVATAERARSAAADDLVAVAANDPRFSTLVGLIKKAGLTDELSGTAKLTVFAPTNAAFAKLPKSTLAKVAADKQLLTSILTYHVAKGALTAAKVAKLNGKTVKTLNGQTVRIKVKNSKVFVNSAQVTRADVKASNGVIHIINRVLIPAT